LVQEHQIDAVVVFGQSRPLHAAALSKARVLGLAVFVFEEGYLRPDYVTLEQGGVNAESSLPRSADFYRALDLAPLPKPLPTRQKFGEVAWIAIEYAMAMWVGRRRYPHYVHHRCLHPIYEGLRWVRNARRSHVSRWIERKAMGELTAIGRHKRYFLVPLQVHNDAQVLCHSPYSGVSEMIEEVLCSFARHADRGDWLVFKHHPLDKPYTDYRSLIHRWARALGIQARVRYIHDQHLPTLLQHARGVVTINSTTGLQSLFHGTPVATLGECIYAIDGLVHTGPLASFWKAPGTVDQPLYEKFRAYVIRETQLNASFYAETPGLPSHTAAKRRSASVSSTAMAADQPLSWSSPTLPTLK
jgi:capsular polysaccharide export protein